MPTMFPAFPFTGTLPATPPVIGSAPLTILVLAGLLIAAVLLLAHLAAPSRRPSPLRRAERRRGVASGSISRPRPAGQRLARLTVATREVTP